MELHGGKEQLRHSSIYCNAKSRGEMLVVEEDPALLEMANRLRRMYLGAEYAETFSIP